MPQVSRNRFVTGMAFAAGLLVVFGAFGRPVPRAKAGAATSHAGIMSWGNPGAQWRKELHISALRVGCSGTPQSCMKYVLSLDRGMKVFLSTVLRLDTLDYGKEYSALSRQDASLEEIGLDDFVSQYWKLQKAGVKNASTVVDTFIDGVKSQNPKLRFGATIYEDDLGTEYLSDKDLPPALRAKFDDIHFFIHFRGDTPKYEEYVDQLKKLFPNARIMGGVYSYDRISYVPCLPKGHTCSPAQEMEYFEQSLDTAKRLLNQGSIEWIEFFPGIFGNEADWSDWRYPRLCPESRRPDCVANTKKMDQVVLSKLKDFPAD